MNARAVAQIALLDAQTAALVGDNHYSLCVLLSALNYIASNGYMYRKKWECYRRIIDDGRNDAPFPEGDRKQDI